MVNKVQYILLLVLMPLVSISCQNELEAQEYLTWMSDPENGLRKDASVGDFELSLMYQPTNYLIAKEISVNNNFDGYENKKETLGEVNNFQFRIKLKNGDHILRYHQNNSINENTRINYFSFLVKDDFKLESKTDTINCKLAHFSRNYNISPTVDLTLMFGELNKSSDWRIIYKDTQFGLGTVKFTIKEEDINNIPSLKV